MANEGEALEIRRRVAPLAAGAAPGLGHQSYLLVIADRLDLRPGLARQPADRQHHCLLNLQPLKVLFVRACGF